MHRIVSGDADGFVTQGDNNDWLDADEPSQDEILGRLLFRIPRGGIALDAADLAGSTRLRRGRPPHRSRLCAPAPGPAQGSRVAISAPRPVPTPSR